MKWNWNELFGNDYYIEIKNSERKYFGLNEIASNWEKVNSIVRPIFVIRKRSFFGKKILLKR